MAASVYAIRQLLCNPEFAKEVSEPLGDLGLDSDPDSQLLVELLKTLKKQPELTTSTLIAQWYGTDQGKRLQSLAALDHGTEAHWDEFQETLKTLREKSRQQQQKNRFSHLLSSLQNKKPGQIDEEHRKKLMQDLQELRRNHGIGTGEEKK